MNEHESATAQSGDAAHNDNADGVEIPVEGIGAAAAADDSNDQQAAFANDDTEDEALASRKKEVAELKERIAALEAERDEFREHAGRKVAELENFRRRTEIERKDTMRYANMDLLRKLLPVLDDLGRAVQAANAGGDFESLRKGVELVYGKARTSFEDAGVTPMEVVGKPFDVNHHEALMAAPSAEHPEGHVVNEVERGYLYHDKVLRHAKVVTSTGAPEAPQASGEAEQPGASIDIKA